MMVNLVEDKLKNCFKTLKENKWCIGEDVKFKIYIYIYIIAKYVNFEILALAACK